MMDLILATGIFSYLTSLQEPREARIIASSSLLFGTLYLLLQQTRLFHPPPNTNTNTNTKKHQPHIEAEWTSRIIGTIHATILSIGSIYCFIEWKHFSPDAYPLHAWYVPLQDLDLPIVKDYTIPLLASFFVGYLQYDMIWMLLHKEKNYDAGMMVHHSLFIAITHYVLKGYYLMKPFAWLSLCELSTPFLHLRWFNAVMGKKNNWWYFFWSTLFMVTFVSVRVVGYGLGLRDLWKNYGYWETLPYGLHVVIGGLHVGYLLNVFWGGFVLLSFVKNLKRRRRNRMSMDGRKQF